MGLCTKYKILLYGTLGYLTIQLLLSLRLPYWNIEERLPMQTSTQQNKLKVPNKESIALGTSSVAKDISINLTEYGLLETCELVGKDAISAVKRAKTQECRQQIVDITCRIQQHTLYPSRLENKCLTKGRSFGDYLGCYEDARSDRLLVGQLFKLKSNNSPINCLDACIESGFGLAGVQYGQECFCGDDIPRTARKLPDDNCDMPCTGDGDFYCGGYLKMNIYFTGLKKLTGTKIDKLSQPVDGSTPVRIVYLLTVNGRAARQVKRLIKSIYHPSNYYYIHVDSTQQYLYRELLTLEHKFSNIRMSRFRLHTIWGGASLLTMLLQCIRDLLAMGDWHWDYVLNLSESDYAIKPNEELISFLTANKGKTFVKSHGKNTPRFVTKQGLDRTFYECEGRMWRLGSREMPNGIRIDGGSDWVVLHRSFCRFVVEFNDPLVEGLKLVYNYTLLPAESFFHTVLRNSEHCENYVDNNLRLTNWKRKVGCQCQYKHIVDWCGCSPNDYKPEDVNKFTATAGRPVFFARKFEPIVNQGVIDMVDELVGRDGKEGSSSLYWENVFHFEDFEPTVNTAFLLAYTVFATRSFAAVTSHSVGQCRLDGVRIREATYFNFQDRHKGTLVLFNASIEHEGARSTVSFETFVSHRPVFTSPQPDSRIDTLSVGTGYDPKEHFFRNMEFVIGSGNDDVTLIHGWRKGKEFTATVHWVQPDGSVILKTELMVDADDYEDILRPKFETPLATGVWSVRVLHKLVLVAETKFLVLPNEELSNVDEEHLKQLMALSSQFYEIHDTCLATSQDDVIGSLFDSCGLSQLDECDVTSWSSLSPDPKSSLDDVVNGG